MSGGRIALLVAGVLLALVGLGIAVGGGGVLWAHSMQRGADGLLTSPTYELSTDGYALTGERIDLGVTRRGDWIPWVGPVDVRLGVTPAGAAPEVFVGIARARDVDAYLEGVAHAEVTRLGPRGTDVSYRERAGGPPGVPGEQAFWVASAEGTGAQDLRWELESGRWAVVVMNADASPGVAVEADAGARVGFLLPLGLALLIGGLVLLGVGAAMVVAATAGRAAPPRAGAAGPARSGATAGTAPASGGTPPGGGRAYPAVLAGYLDDGLSRWLWLVKWLLVLPHVVVLALLWLAFVVLTVVAGFAILFTGRYPRGIFDFNAGVLRWTWRVGFYSYSALGTDRYPPFSLEARDYPATLEVAYPERLSRGLVLVKWWLLAIPHYLVVAVLAGGALSWSSEVGGRTWQWPVSGGVIGVLVLVAGIALLFTARYPAGLFDLVVGLNRWVYRVIAYAALMTDEYPPFRLDLGGEDPGTAPEPPARGPSSAAQAGPGVAPG